MNNHIENKEVPRNLTDRHALLLVMGVSLAIKVVILLSSPVITPDGPVYISQAQEFLNGNWRKGLAIHGNMFLYPLLIAGLNFVVSDLVLAGRILSLVFSVSTLIPLFLLSRNIFGPRVAIWTGLAFAVSPGLNEFSVYVMRDPGFLCMFAWALYFAINALESKKASSFGLFLFFSVLAFLFRVEGIFLILLYPVFVLSHSIFSKKNRRGLLKGGCGILFFILIFLGISYSLGGKDLLKYNRIQSVISLVKKPFEKGLFSYDPQVKSGLIEMEAVLPKGAVDNDFAEIARENIRLIYFLGLLSNIKKVIYPLFFVALLVGIFMFRDFRPCSLFLIFIGFSYLLMNYLYLLHMFFIETRYVYASVLIILPWAGLGIDKIYHLFKKISHPQVSLALLVAFFFLVPGVESATDVKRQMVSSKLAGEWLAQHPEFNQGVMLSNNREIPFYSGRGVRDFVYLKNFDSHNVKQIERKAIRKKAQIIGIVQRHHNETNDPEFEKFILINKFKDKKYISYLYREKP